MSFLMAAVLMVGLTSCGDRSEARIPGPETTTQIVKKAGKISEVSPPEVIQTLRQSLEKYQPQVTIVSPRPNEVLQDNTVALRFQVKDLPIFQDPKLGLGPHLHVILDNEPYEAVYNLDQPLVLKDLPPGTHTLRVFASRPWHESFKNEGAYAQTTFHVFTKTPENSPNLDQPLLTYSRPKGSYGAEPIMLDFYLTNAPLHWVAQESSEDEISDWRIRCTINGESFVIDRWQPIYLKGFQPGKNWVQLEFIDEQGNPVSNAFNDTARLITYEANGTDTLSKLIRGEISADQARSIVDPNYQPEVVSPLPTTAPEPAPAPTPKPSELPIFPEESEESVEELPTVEEAEPETPPTLETPAVEETVPQPSVPSTPPIETPQKPEGFFNRFRRQTPSPVAPLPSAAPTLPDVMEAPNAEEVPEAEPDVIPMPEPASETTETPESPTATPHESAESAPAQEPEKPTGFFRFRRPVSSPVIPAPSATPGLPKVIEAPAIEEPISTEPESPATEAESEPSMPPAIAEPEPATEQEPITQPAKPEKPGGLFNRFRFPSASPALPSPAPSLPDLLETLDNTVAPEEPELVPAPSAEEANEPEEEVPAAPEVAPPSEAPKSGGFWNRFRRPEASPVLPTPSSVPSLPETLEAPEVEEPSSIKAEPAIAPTPEPTPAPTAEPDLSPSKPTGFFRFRRPAIAPTTPASEQLGSPANQETTVKLSEPGAPEATPETPETVPNAENAEPQPEEPQVDAVDKYKDIFEQLRRPQPNQVLPAPTPAPQTLPEVVVPAPSKFNTPKKAAPAIAPRRPEPSAVKPQPTPAAPVIQAPEQSERLRQLREKFTAPAPTAPEVESAADPEATEQVTPEVDASTP